MKVNKLLLISVSGLLTLVSCGGGGSSTPASSSSSIESSSSSSSQETSQATSTETSAATSSAEESTMSTEITSDDETSSDEPWITSVEPPVFDIKNFETALQKDYTNMQTAYYLVSSYGEAEYGYEYYLGDNDLVAVLDGNTAEMYGTSYAWMYYANYEGENYAYWDASYYVTSGWISHGSKGITVGIDYAYFYMPYVLANITVDDVDEILGTYVVKESSMEKVLNGFKFTWMTNDITYIDFKLNEDGYISRIRGFDDPNNDEIGFQVELGNFGTTVYPTVSNPLPPEIGPDTIKTYAEMIGHEEEPDVYLDSLDVQINDDVESDDDFDIILDINDSIDLSFLYTPENANKKEVRWHSTNEDVVAFDIFLNHQSGHKYLTAISEGTAEIYVTHVNGEKQTISSRKLKVKVKGPKSIEESEESVYSFLFDGQKEIQDNYYEIDATNKINTAAPYEIHSHHIYVGKGYGDSSFTTDDILLVADPCSQDTLNSDYDIDVIFDFASQQVSSIDFLYALMYSNQKSNVDKISEIKLSTSNDGVNWIDVDLTAEMKAEFSKVTYSAPMSAKVMHKEFEPASLVKITYDRNSIGGSCCVGMKDFLFNANEDCANFDDPESSKIQSIEISAPKNKLKVGYSMNLLTSVNPEDASTKGVRYYSSEPSIIYVDSRTGMLTALAEGEATIFAKTLDGKVISNELVIEAYSQESIVDEDHVFVGRSYFAANVESGRNHFDVRFSAIDNKNAEIDLMIDLGTGAPFTSTYSFIFDEYDEESRTYFYSNANGDYLEVALANDNLSVDVKLLVGGSENYLLGNAIAGVTLALEEK